MTASLTFQHNLCTRDGGPDGGVERRDAAPPRFVKPRHDRLCRLLACSSDGCASGTNHDAVWVPRDGENDAPQAPPREQAGTAGWCHNPKNLVNLQIRS